MASPAPDIALLLRATVKLYRAAAFDAAKGLRLNWWAGFFPFAYAAILLAGLLLVAPLFGGFLASFAAGLLLCFLIAHYFSLVAASVRGEKSSLRLSLSAAKELFFPLMGLLFAFFILNMVADAALRRPEHYWIRSSLNLIVFVLFNALPEVLYTRHGSLSLESFSESFEFIKENFLEWLVPMALVFSPIIFADPVRALGILAQANPLQAGFSLAMQSAMSSVVMSLAVLPLVFLFMIFRGALFVRLSCSSRRKRIYQEKFGGSA